MSSGSNDKCLTEKYPPSLMYIPNMVSIVGVVMGKLVPSRKTDVGKYIAVSRP